MKYPAIFRSITFFILLLTGFSLHVRSQSGKKPNIIYILVDDMGYGDLGVLFQQQRAKTNDRSEPWMITPSLDSMAADGALLTQHYCAAPVCAPSRASLLLGVSQGHANVRDNQFDKALEDNYTMANVLKSAGYHTAAIGKWGLQGDKRWDKNGEAWPAHPLNRGFDYFLGYMRHEDGHEHYPKEGIYRGKKQVWENRTNIADGLDKCYTADLWIAAAKKWITQHAQENNKGNPFFMFLAFDTPHAVLELGTQAYPAGGGLKGGLQWLGTAGHMINTASGTPDSYVHPDYAHATYDDDKDPNTKEVPWPDTYKRYASAVRRIDKGVADIRQLLRDLQLDENTMIVFTSDNGPSDESYLPKGYVTNNPDFFNSFGLFDGIKRDCWEGGVRMPAIACWPGHIPAGQVNNTPGIMYDWLPTFIDAAGMPAPARTDGVSLLPTLTGKGRQRNSLVYVEYFNNGWTPRLKEFAKQHQDRQRNQMQLIRMGNYVGVRYDIKTADDDFEIYNVVNDPGERDNLAKQPDDLINALQRAMKAEVLQVRRPDSAAKRPYDEEAIPAVKLKIITQGLNYKTYMGNFPWIPDVSTLRKKKSGHTKGSDIFRLQKQADIIYYTGYINVQETGLYTFSLSTSGNALMRIHDATVIDADYGYESGSVRSGSISLQAGLHPVRIYYKPGKDKPTGLDMFWEGPGIVRSVVSHEVFFR